MSPPTHHLPLSTYLWLTIAQGMFQLREINQMVREMWNLGCMSIQQLWKSLPACFFSFFFSSSFGESPHPPSTAVYLLMVNRHTGHVPVERNQPDGGEMCQYLEWGLHVDPATLKEFAPHVSIFFSFDESPHPPSAAI